MSDARKKLTELAHDSLDKGDVTGWFEKLYDGAGRDFSQIPWADLAPNPHLVSWHNGRRGAGRAVVVGAGLGDDAEYLSSLGYDVVAFDIAESAIRRAKERFPQTRVEYMVGDLTSPDEDWHFAFAFVFEAYTVQALPFGSRERDRCLRALPWMVAPGGEMLLIARGREESDPAGELPWPMTHEEIQRLESNGLRIDSFEDFADGAERRFRVLLRKRDLGASA